MRTNNYDDKEICRSLSSVFRKKGFEVKVANSSKDALCILREARYDLAIIDRCLPDGKGTDLLEPLRTTQPYAIKIMLTGTPTYGETEFNASQLGIDAFLLKPVNLHELIALIENKLNAKRSKRVQSHYLLGLLFT